MNKSLFCPWLCLFAILLMSCGQADRRFEPDSMQVTSTTIGDDDMERIEMTSLEMELLSQFYQDEDRIREGKLFSHQAEALLQLRTEMEYLAQKYPNGTYTITAFQPDIKFNSGAELTVEDGGIYTVYAEAEGDRYVCSDNYYGKYLQPRYDEYLEEILTNNGYTCKSYTSFPAASDVLGAETSVEQLLELTPRQTRMVDLFITAQDHDKAVQDIKDLMTQARLYGSYTVYFVTNLIDVQSLEAQRADMEHITFSCFDI